MSQDVTGTMNGAKLYFLRKLVFLENVHVISKGHHLANLHKYLHDPSWHHPAVQGCPHCCLHQQWLQYAMHFDLACAQQKFRGFEMQLY